MILFVPNLCLVLYMFTKVSGNEVTAKTDPLTTSNNAKSITVENQKLDLDLDKTKNHTTEAFTTKTPPSKFDMKDFKVTKLQSNHNEEDLEDCWAFADPEKVKAVRKILKNDGVTSESLHLSDEEAKIAACLKKENTKTTNTITTDMKGDNKTATKTPLETVEEVEMNVEEQAKKKRRRDTEYKFDPLEYYDETVTFDLSTCPAGNVEVIDLEIAELKQYDVECELLTHWIGLIDTM